MSSVTKVTTNRCRICLDMGNIPIFGDNNTPDISKEVTTFGAIDIGCYDEHPQYLCEACHKLLQAAILFRKKAKQTEILLKNKRIDLENSKFELRYDNKKSDSLKSLKDDVVKTEKDINSENGSDNEFKSDNSMIMIVLSDKEFNSVSKNKFPYGCETCNINFETTEELDEHKKSPDHKNRQRRLLKMECKICNKTLSKAYYKQHLILHGAEIENTEINRECPLCNKTFRSTYYNDHVKRCSVNKNLEANTRKASTQTKVQCPICKNKYKRDYIKYHLATHKNGASKSSKYICDKCGKSFIQPSALKVHSLTHGNELPFQCQFCPYRGRHLALLKIHVRTHTGDYQYKCDQCPSQFITKSNLNRHLQRHRGPIDFKCETCKRGFYSKLELDRHHKAEHLGIKNHVCNICGKAFGYRNGMMSHQLKVHKREKKTKGKGRLPLYLEMESKSKSTEES